MLADSFKEISRVLKKGGQLFISDATPNKDDVVGFVDDYMEVKDDGHIKFYSYDEFVKIANDVGFRLDKHFSTQITFPRKNAEEYLTIVNKYSVKITRGYNIYRVGDEIFITEQVINLSLIKE